MYTLKAIARRASLLGMAFALAVSTVTPFAPSAFADALNPLTERSLTLSSSAPGWDYLDGSGNTTYAPPNSGANGQKVGNYFDFKVTTDTDTSDLLKAMSFQYCTSPAGNCLAPGDNGWTGSTRNADDADNSDLNVTVSAASQASIAEDDPTDYATMSDTSTTTNPNGDFTSLPCSNDDTPGVAGYQPNDCSSIPGKNFAVYWDNAGTWTESTGWSMSAANFESYNGVKSTGSVAAQATGKNNEIRLVHSGTTGFPAGARVRVVFFATDTNYITNPGSGAFFVRINTYNTAGNTAINTMARYDETNVIDGGVTVANVMNLGIQIVTKVLETMAFSVGVVDPYTLEAIAVNDNGTPGDPGDDTYPPSQLNQSEAGVNVHGVCEPILKQMVAGSSETANRLSLGDPTSEYSLAVDKTFSTHSYFRLSSNSSAGATVYYSGNTLTNTVGDSINAVGDPQGDGTSDGLAAAPSPGSEQFGLALAINSADPYAIDYRTETKSGYVYETGADLTEGNVAAGLATYGSTQGVHSSVTDDNISDLDVSGGVWHSPRLSTLTAAPQYGNGGGYINAVYNNNALTDSLFAGDPTSFAFKPESTLVPVPIASNESQVVDCVTGKMRYIANIAATTPAGIYTTKINYIAAPQY